MDNLIPVEYKKQRVLTTQQVAENFKVDSVMISNNYNRNITRFREGIHYFKLEGQALKEFKTNHLLDESSKRVNCLYFWTKRGVARHAKILETDEAWMVYEELEETYFKVHQLYPQTDAEIIALGYQKAIEQIAIMKPKADYFDALVEKNLLTSFRDTAKELKIKETDLINWLSGNKYIYRDIKDKIKPYAQYVPTLFEEKEYKNPKNDHVGLQTLITPKGRETFRLLLIKDGYIQEAC
jgi:phage antirepressor YoqD-like protein